MTLFNIILHKILYPKNTIDEIYASKNTKTDFDTIIKESKNKKQHIYINPIYKFYIFMFADFYNVNMSQPADSIWEIANYKYSFLKKQLNNMFTNDTYMEDILQIFYEVQKTYHALSRFIHIWKHKRSQVKTSTDLYLNPIDRSSKSIFSLLQNGKIYLFSAANLSNILCTALSNAPNFFVDPLPAKNPYNNIPFTKADLYNMYFFMKQTPLIMPILFHAFYLSGFDLRKFRDDNENMIRDIAIKNYVNNCHTSSLRESIGCMIFHYTPEIKIDPLFPNDKLFEIMKPYITLYYTIKYSNNEYKKIAADALLEYKLKKLYKYNCAFGRKYVRLVPIGNVFNKKKMKIIEYNDNHPNFYEQEDIESYKLSHLEILPTTYDSSDSSEDSHESREEDNLHNETSTSNSEDSDESDEEDNENEYVIQIISTSDENTEEDSDDDTEDNEGNDESDNDD